MIGRARVVLVGLVVAASGCGPADDGRAPVTGTVSLDGAPLAGVTVAFFPEPGSPGQGGFGRTDAQGRYEIAYDFTGKGLVPGKYRVTVVKTPPGAPGDDGGLIDSPVRAGAGIPGIYGNPESTPLRATVEPDGRPIDLKLETPRKPSAK
ncbi:MAG TPA: carboxypeptidase-like regulatory domain-containing protein [Gemmataceae bacterium]|nr:carboxypeptidase-like regulatory domain-containing protein [Gemmataceae bacterium]